MPVSKTGARETVPVPPTRRLSDGSALRVLEHPSGNRTVLMPRSPDEPPAPEPRRGEVQWYVPYTAVHPLTVGGAPPDAIWIDNSSSANAYYGALLDIWDRGETFAVLEHDVICRPDVVESFETCPEPWCIYGYSDICHRGCMEAWRNALGCTRFRKEIIEAVPDAFTSVTDPAEWDWHNVCDRLGERLRAAGFTHHWHEPWVGHHRGVQSPEQCEEYLAGLAQRDAEYATALAAQ